MPLKLLTNAKTAEEKAAFYKSLYEKELAQAREELKSCEKEKYAS